MVKQNSGEFTGGIKISPVNFGTTSFVRVEDEGLEGRVQ